MATASAVITTLLTELAREGGEKLADSIRKRGIVGTAKKVGCAIGFKKACKKKQTSSQATRRDAKNGNSNTPAPAPFKVSGSTTRKIVRVNRRNTRRR